MRLVNLDNVLPSIVKIQASDDEPNAKVGKILIALTDAPAVEVVRCKDCKLYMTINCTCDGCCISDDWYCADGERKEVPEDV